ncbi:LETM1 domain-containing protein 1 isoform X2 [Rissa tridactyla]|uniref:LETM1 domain-containing protein 1 isoform X2 n=1 Tax=Rissa tridactyla TaxID=75485 RepID=UPI0023BA8F19|nr:LETM1 domain-containing protein 1 isoform X2 [Rissa tridactyla]
MQGTALRVLGWRNLLAQFPPSCLCSASNVPLPASCPAARAKSRLNPWIFQFRSLAFVSCGWVRAPPCKMAQGGDLRVVWNLGCSGGAPVGHDGDPIARSSPFQALCGLWRSQSPSMTRYFFPRQLLIRYFWTPSQQVEFLDAYDAIRRDSYPDVVKSIALAARSLPEPQLQKRLQELCAEVQRGSQPRVAELYAVRSLFSGSPLGLNKLQVSHVRALSQVLFLTPHLPAFFLRHRLRSHVLEIRHLDRAMLRLGLGQLSEEELKAACYIRGLNSTHLGMSECRAWLEQWLGLSCKLQASEASLLANSMVLLSLNYLRAKE